MRVPILLAIAISFVVFISNARSGEVTGPYANRLSSADVTQIKAAVRADRSVGPNVKKIQAVRPDKVAIQTTRRTAVDEDTTYDFNVYKRAGGWAIDANSIQMSIEKRDFRTNGPTIIR
jgi:hypothetical protein